MTKLTEGQSGDVVLDGRHHESVDTSASLLANYYRCPKDSLRFLPSAPTNKRQGFFHFGKNTICYGRLSSDDAAPHFTDELTDVLEQVIADAAGVRLPFNAGEVVENLRRERYAFQSAGAGQNPGRIIRRIYYFIRPLLRTSVRRHLQKRYLRSWNKIRFPAWPVDTTVDRIHQKLLALSLRAQGLEEIPFIWFWPESFSSCAIVTHDVEDLAGRDFCSKLMDLDESFGIRSAFQVVPEDRYPVSKSFLESIAGRGFELNVHDLKHDGYLFANHAEFVRRAKRINEYIEEFGARGFRSGILYRNADWFDAFEFSYDMSIPNVAHLDPQRGGCCTVMPFFIGKIVELPLTCTQDYTLFHIFDDYSMDLWKMQIAMLQKSNGLISFIVHPDFVIDQRARETYKLLLDHLVGSKARDNIWIALPRDVDAWWRMRSQMELVHERGSWRVEGPGKERARVALATLSGDTVTYSLAE